MTKATPGMRVVAAKPPTKCSGRNVEIISTADRPARLPTGDRMTLLSSRRAHRRIKAAFFKLPRSRAIAGDAQIQPPFTLPFRRGDRVLSVG